MFMPLGGGFGDIMFTVVPIIITMVFVVVCGSMILRSVQGLRQWKKNNASPLLAVDARVMAKRAAVQYHQHQQHAGAENMHHHLSTTSSTTYYATFEVESGDRLEFALPDSEYGLLAENDLGKLTFQGTRYMGFERYK